MLYLSLIHIYLRFLLRLMEKVRKAIQQAVLLDGLAHLFHQAQEEAQVVDAGQARAGDLDVYKRQSRISPYSSEV